MFRRVAASAFTCAALAALYACGSFGAADSSGAADAASDVVADGAASGPCELDEPFGSPKQLKEKTSLSVEAVRPVNDRVDDLISTTCATSSLASCDIHRTDTAALGSSAGKMSGLSLANQEDSFPFFHGASSRVFFARTVPDASPPGSKHLFLSTSALDAPALLDIAPASDGDREPYIVGDILFFARRVATESRIWSVTLDAQGTPTGIATQVPLPFQGDLFTPVVSSDLKEIFLAVEESPGFSLRAARRGGPTEPFVVSTAAFSDLPGDPVAYPVWVSPDRCTLWVVTKESGTNHGSVLVYERPTR